MTGASKSIGLPRLLRVATVARHLAVDRRRVYALIRAGAFRAVRVSRRGDYRVDEASVIAWLRRQTEALQALRAAR